LAVQAAALGHEAISVTDRNSLAGVVRAHRSCSLWTACAVDHAWAAACRERGMPANP
jgi:hypothetical protein